MYDVTASMTNDEDFDLSFVITDADDVERDIATFDIEFTLADDDGSQVLSRTSVGGDITKDIATSTVSIVVPATHFGGLDPGVYTMGCRYQDSVTGITKQLFTGQLTLVEGGF